MKVITISGKAQNGKDTTARLLKDVLEDDGNTVLIAHYADLLKYICKQFFGWDGNKDEQGRHTLQYVGTDVIRKEWNCLGSARYYAVKHWTLSAILSSAMLKKGCCRTTKKARLKWTSSIALLAFLGYMRLSRSLGILRPMNLDM